MTNENETKVEVTETSTQESVKVTQKSDKPPAPSGGYTEMRVRLPLTVPGPKGPNRLKGWSREGAQAAAEYGVRRYFQDAFAGIEKTPSKLAAYQRKVAFVESGKVQEGMRAAGTNRVTDPILAETRAQLVVEIVRKGTPSMKKAVKKTKLNSWDAIETFAKTNKLINTLARVRTNAEKVVAIRAKARSAKVELD